jgi:proteasome lid subunit RPN8/RPN11
MKLRHAMVNKMKEHLEQTYPYEGCGVMLGKDNVVTDIYRGSNIRQERKEDRFVLDPSDIINAEKYAKQQGIEVLGFYHSHPDHPARPSTTDLESAWESYYYIIVSIDKGAMGKMGLFRLSEQADRFIEEVINIED